MTKTATAFRTISEVAEWIGLPAHVLRFWESKFAVIRPVKGAGGRRYYRPEDMALLSGIQVLLHEQGLTIRGAQKLIREQGVKYVISLGKSPDGVELPAQAARAPSPLLEAIVQPQPVSLARLASQIDPQKALQQRRKLAETLQRLESLRGRLQASS